MDFIIKPYIGALPLTFGMSSEQVSSLFPQISKGDVVSFGPSQVNLNDDIFLHFEDGKLVEIEFYTASNNYNTGELAELTPDLYLTLELDGQQLTVLQQDDTLDLLNRLDTPKYAEGVWIYPKIGATFYGYDRSQDYRSFTLFAKDLLSFHLEGANDAPASTRLRPTD